MVDPILQDLADAPLVDLDAVLDSMTQDRLEALCTAFPEWAHGGQLPPPGDWLVWVMLAGRGFGKTRAGAEWVLDLVRRADHSGTVPKSLRIALVAATLDEARRVMVEGPSGLLACAQAGEIADWSPSLRTLRFESGAQVSLYSGASPESLRGPEHDFAWCDELAKWGRAQECWDNLMLGMRRGERPRTLVTTTPRPGPVLRRILDQAGTVQTGGSTRANPYLPPAFVSAVEAQFGGTRIGAQELDGVLLADVEGSLWPSALIERCRCVAGARDYARIVIGVDPPASAHGTCGIVACGLGRDGKAYVLADESVMGRSPEGWARAVADAAGRHGADRVIVESNQGGDMVSSVLRAASATLPIEKVHASRNKVTRAEPVAALFESGDAWFAGRFPELEAQLSALVAGGGYQGHSTGSAARSPDRADACVWAIWALKLKARAEPHIRML
jgi:phage terminase large subunit-like protein